MNKCLNLFLIQQYCIQFRKHGFQPSEHSVFPGRTFWTGCCSCRRGRRSSRRRTARRTRRRSSAAGGNKPTA